MSFTFKHVDDFCIASKFSPVPPTPGQVYQIDGKYMAAAGWTDGVVSFIAKKGSWIDNFNQERYQFNGPTGPGFSQPDSENAIIVAGGTGIGAAISLMKHRDKKLNTHLLYYQRGGNSYQSLVDKLGQQPHTNTRTLWDTKKQGRPSQPLLPLQVRSDWRGNFKDYHYYVVGPKSLVDSVKEQCKSLGVPDTNIHTNY